MNVIILFFVIFTFTCFFYLPVESFRPYNTYTFPSSNTLYDDETRDINLILSNIFNNIESNSTSIEFQPYPWYSKFPFISEFSNVVETIFNKYLTTYEIKIIKSIDKLEYFNNHETNTILFKYDVSGRSNKKSFTRSFSITIELNNASKYFYNDTFLNVFPLSSEDITVKSVKLLSVNLPPSPNSFEPPIGNEQYNNYYRIKNRLGLTTPFHTSKKYLDLPTISPEY